MCICEFISDILYICVFVCVNTACMLTVSPCLLSISCLLSRVSLYQTAFKRYFRIPGYKRKPAAQINRAGHRNCIISMTDTASGQENYSDCERSCRRQRRSQDAVASSIVHVLKEEERLHGDEKGEEHWSRQYLG